jgi:hypothetical protein
VRRVWISLVVCLSAAACSGEKREQRGVNPQLLRDAGAVADTGVPATWPDAAGGQPDALVLPDAGEPPDSGIVMEPDSGVDICTGGPDKVQRLRLDVVNGTRSPTFVPLSAAQIMAIVGLTEGTPVDALCSGTLIAPRWVLTAQHCTEGVSASDMWVLFGTDDQNPDAAISVNAKHEHPDHDMALLELDQDATTQVMVQPIYIPLFDLGQMDLGRTMEQAGYGQTETGNTDGRLFVAEVLSGFEEQGDRNLVVDGMGVHGVCFGDSGGPSLAIAPEGDVRVMGALSWGDESCVGEDRYARTDWARAWIESYTGPTPAVGGPQPCGSVSATGICSNGGMRASYCANNELQVEDCSSGQVCGWSGVADAGRGGWRCMARASDPCGGIGFQGSCDAETLSWCERGVVYTRPCGVCGEDCVEIDATFGFDCQVNECGDLDYLGRCNGNVAEWCDEGMIKTEDCAARGEICTYIDNEIGYYCR